MKKLSNFLASLSGSIYKDSGFTTTFDLIATFFAMEINKSAASRLLRCDWHTIMRCISRVREFLEPDLKKRYDRLVNIGIDETSYRKGHTYVTVVVNHDTNTVVWCSPGHSTETLSQFFEELTHEQKDSIKCVSGDGAKWIDACMEKYIPNATCRVDPFHVVTWAMESLDTYVRISGENTVTKQETLLKNIHERKADIKLMTKIQPNSIN